MDEAIENYHNDVFDYAMVFGTSFSKNIVSFLCSQSTAFQTQQTFGVLSRKTEKNDFFLVLTNFYAFSLFHIKFYINNKIKLNLVNACNTILYTYYVNNLYLLVKVLILNVMSVCV